MMHDMFVVMRHARPPPSLLLSPPLSSALARRTRLGRREQRPRDVVAVVREEEAVQKDVRHVLEPDAVGVREQRGGARAREQVGGAAGLAERAILRAAADAAR